MQNSKIGAIFKAVNLGKVEEARDLVGNGDKDNDELKELDGLLVKEQDGEQQPQNNGSGQGQNPQEQKEQHNNGQGQSNNGENEDKEQDGEQQKQKSKSKSKQKQKDQDKEKQEEKERKNKKPDMDEYIKPKEYEKVKKYICKNKPVVLYGAAGTGKSTMVEHIAKELGINFYSCNSVNDKFELSGFQDATGVFQSTQFYDFCVNGGIFCFDEIDASVPEALVAFNTAIAQRFFVFQKVGRVNLHPNCRFVACANTFGDGATLQYVGRNPIDGACRNRYIWALIDYNKKVELTMAKNDEDLVNFIDDLRQSAYKNIPTLIVSYRNIDFIADMEEEDIPLDELLKDCLLSSIDTDDLKSLWGDMKPCDNKYYKAFKKLAKIRD